MSQENKTQKETVQKVKIQPYPIRATFEGDLKGEGEIHRLVPIGLQMVSFDPLKVHDKLIIKWDMPVSYKEMTANVRVMKTYDQYGDKDESGRPRRLIECHFISPDARLLNTIDEFISEIGQKN